MRSRWVAGGLGFAAGLMLLWGGCSTASRTSDDPLGAAPEDFSVDVTVLCGRAAMERSEAHLRPGRYVVFPDGSLHCGWEEGRGPNWLPGKVRTLDRRETAGLWSLVKQVGFVEEAEEGEAENLELIEPPRNGLAYLIALTGRGERWTVVRRSAGSERADAACAALVRHLAELAWVMDKEEEGWVMPVRYEFGADPYARYRRHENGE